MSFCASVQSWALYQVQRNWLELPLKANSEEILCIIITIRAYFVCIWEISQGTSAPPEGSLQHTQSARGPVKACCTTAFVAKSKDKCSQTGKNWKQEGRPSRRTPEVDIGDEIEARKGEQSDLWGIEWPVPSYISAPWCGVLHIIFCLVGTPSPPSPRKAG